MATAPRWSWPRPATRTAAWSRRCGCRWRERGARGLSAMHEALVVNASESRPMPTALIAEDEPLLAANLQAELQRLWPELKIVATVGHGEAAVEQALALQPELLFLDIRMPGMTGLEAAQAIAEDWPDDAPKP